MGHLGTGSHDKQYSHHQPHHPHMGDHRFYTGPRCCANQAHPDFCRLRRALDGALEAIYEIEEYASYEAYTEASNTDM